MLQAQSTENMRIKKVSPVLTPREVKAQRPLTEEAAATVQTGRTEIERIISGEDDRLLVIVGPCSIHDPKSALEYAERLMKLREVYAKKLCIIMRVYFEKPRTTIGWEGLIVEPDLTEPYNFDKGFLLAREILLKINELGLPTATELLDTVTPQYIGDLVSWAAIGARTTESQNHRHMASGLSCPVGFKNGTSGSAQIAVDGMVAARHPHNFLGTCEDGKSCVFETMGNESTQLILRGGRGGANYEQQYVAEAAALLKEAGLPVSILVDCSHANSGKDHRNQAQVLRYVHEHRGSEYPVDGVMIESHLVSGRQDIAPLAELTYGQSITDACEGWDETKALLDDIAA